MDINKEYISGHLERDETINIRAELEKYLVHWKWFVLGVFIAFVAAFLYLRYTAPQYSAKTVILIKENQKSGISAEMKAFEDLGILGGSTNNIDNEIEVIKSRKIIGEVIRKLKLNVTYYTSSRIYESEIYNRSPFRVVFPINDSLIYKRDTTFSINWIEKNSFEINSEDESIKETHSFGEDIRSDIGTFKVYLKEDANEEYLNLKVRVQLSNLDKLVDSYQTRVSVAPTNKNSGVLNLELKDAVKEKAVDFLNELVDVYNKDAVEDKNQVSQKTKEFIDDRLGIVGESLSDINTRLKDFKTKNKLTNVEAESALVLQVLSDNNAKIVETSIQLTLVRALNGELLKSDVGNETILATNLGLEDQTIAQSIIEYNQLITAKKRLLRSATEKNPQVINLTEQIKSVQSSLIQSLKNAEKTIALTLNNLRTEDAKIKSRISGVPLQELQLHDIRLQQEISSGLYQYLLKKKEETAISLAVTVANAKIIDRAYGSGIPVSPKRKIIYLAALSLGVLIPFISIYLRNLLDTKIHNKTDLEEIVSVPYLGDIPKSESKEKIVIGADARSSSAEAFRLLRTNLDFMLANSKNKNKTIFVTSTTSGEGKSYVSINIAASLALSGKKVLLMGMDLRAPKVTQYLGLADRKGVTNYVTSDELTFEELIFHVDEIKNLDIVSSGVVPPNPAELLLSKRIESLFEKVKGEYDYVVVDTAPVNLVTDTLLLAKHADMFVYIARANYLDKRLLAIPKTLYKEKRLPNMAMVLNDTDPKRSYGYGGYGYGGYGYYIGEKKPWYKRIFGN